MSRFKMFDKKSILIKCCRNSPYICLILIMYFGHSNMQSCTTNIYKNFIEQPFHGSLHCNTMVFKHNTETPFKKATFGLGCFWSCDCQFGVVPGVLRTRVGYSGGTTKNPIYRQIGDHTEVIEIDYDPNTVSYAELLKVFWNSHEYGLMTKLKRQYMSLILYHDEEQKKIAEESMKSESEKRNEKLITIIQKADTFYPAETYHQKYRLQQHPFLVDQLGIYNDLLFTSHVAAKLNGYVVGLGGLEQFEKEAKDLGLTGKIAEYVKKQIIKHSGGSLHC